MNMIDEKLNMTQEWDKVFPQSGKTDHRKVTFHNRYGITLAADLYAPKDAACGQRPARRSKGTVLQLVCTENGGVRLSDTCL